MKIVIFHNFYRLPGGEDYVVQAEKQLLEQHGHDVSLYAVQNTVLEELNPWQKFRSTLWNKTIYRELSEFLKKEKPDLLHLHNDFPFASPSVIHAAKNSGVKIVQTLHNYRQMCINGLLSRGGSPCEKCISKTFALSGIRHRCYRDSMAASIAATLRNTLHRRRKTWQDVIDGFIAPTEFVKQKYVMHGIQPDRIAVKPHFLENEISRHKVGGQYALVLGRLTPEKGVDQILDIYKQDATLGPIKFVGEGPLESRIKKQAQLDPRITLHGWADADALKQLLISARFVICGARVYETFGRVIMEGFAYGKPAVCAKGGAFEELVTHGITGFVYDGQSGDGLLKAMHQMENHLKTHEQKMSDACYETYQEKYRAPENYQQLMSIYQNALSGKPVGDHQQLHQVSLSQSNAA